MFWTTLAWAATPTPPVQHLTMPEAVARIASDSPVAAGLSAQQSAAHAGVHAATSRFMPTLALNGKYVRNNTSAIAPLGSLFALIPNPPANVTLPGDLVIQPLSQWLGGAELTVPLIAASAWAEQGASRKVLQAVDAGADATLRQSTLALQLSAWAAHAAQQTFDATQSGLDKARAHHASTQRRQAAGLNTELDVLQAEAELLRREQLATQAALTLDTARRELGQLLGIQGPVDVDPGALPSMDPSEISLAAHPEHLRLEAQRQAAAQSRLAARLTHLPTVAGFATAAASDQPFPTGKKYAWTVGAQARWVLFDGGARYAMADQAGAQVAAAEAELWRTDTALDKRLQDARGHADAAQAQLSFAEKGVEVAAAAEATSQRLFESGVINSLDNLDAQQRRMEAEVGLAQARAQLASARLTLDSLRAR